MTGWLGGASLGLADPNVESCGLGDLIDESALRRYWVPMPRLGVGQALRGIATAAIDISDGLSSDLAHISRASGVACRVDLAQASSFSRGVRRSRRPHRATTTNWLSRHRAAFGQRMTMLSQQAHVDIHEIGTVTNGPPGRVEWLHDGAPVVVPRGYRHF